jgi:integrase
MGPKPELYRRHRPACKIGKRKGSQRRGFDPGCDCPVWRDVWLKDKHGRPLLDEKGQPKRDNKSTGTNDWAEAILLAMTYPAGEVPVASPVGTEHAYGVRPAPAGEMTLAAAIERYLAKRRLDIKQEHIEDSTMAAITGTLDAFSAVVGPGTFLSAITRQTFESYRNARLTKTDRRPEGLKPSTLAKEIRHLRTWWLYLEEEGLVPTIAPKKLPMSTFKPPAETSDQQKVGFSTEQIAAIKAAVARVPFGGQHTAEYNRTRMRALVHLMLNSGLAIIDVAKLKRSAITPATCEDGKPGCVRLIAKRQKTHKNRKRLPISIILNRETAEALAALPNIGPYYFQKSDAKSATTVCNVRSSIYGLLKLAGSTEVVDSQGIAHKASPHTFRHTCAYLLRAAGASDEDAAAWLGHDVETFRKYYCGVTPADQKRRDAISLDF